MREDLCALFTYDSDLHTAAEDLASTHWR